MVERIKEIQNILNYNECALINSNINRKYLTNFNSSAGMVVITKKNAYFFVDFRYYEKAKNTIKNLTVIKTIRLYSQVKEILNEFNITKIYTETHFVSVNWFNNLKNIFENYEISNSNIISATLEDLRVVKSENEIDCIKKAQNITDRAFSHILNMIKVGITEKEIALELEFFMRKNGCEASAFDIIVVSGKNSSLPHGVPTDKQLEYGDFVTMDFGGVINGYCSDMTRTVAIGNVTDRQGEIYNIVLEAQKAALEKIRAGAVCKEIDAIARDYITQRGYGESFGHGLGHSVGLEIHESPAFNTRDESKLKSGTVITVEPGIYLENLFGVRIEDMVIVTDNGYVNLTQSKKELLIL